MKRKLYDLPEHMRTREWIESEIRYEEHKGTHTYHDCECGRNRFQDSAIPDPCRSYMCATCWRELLEELK